MKTIPRPGAARFPRTLLAEDDGSRWRQCKRDHWFQLAIHSVRGLQQRYLVSIQFHPHPSKEPFRMAREFTSPVEAALFLITYDPVPILVSNQSLNVNKREMRRFYDQQLHDLLRNFEKKHV